MSRIDELSEEAMRGSGCEGERDAVVKAIRTYGEEVRKKAAREIPGNWIDSLLTGKEKVIDGHPYTPLDIEHLLNAVRSRVENMELP